MKASTSNFSISGATRLFSLPFRRSVGWSSRPSRPLEELTTPWDRSPWSRKPPRHIKTFASVFSARLSAPAQDKTITPQLRCRNRDPHGCTRASPQGRKRAERAMNRPPAQGPRSATSSPGKSRGIRIQPANRTTQFIQHQLAAARSQIRGRRKQWSALSQHSPTGWRHPADGSSWENADPVCAARHERAAAQGDASTGCLGSAPEVSG